MAAVVATALAGGLLAASPSPAAATPHRGSAVVALVDTGINPYHEVFRDRSPRAYRHPSTYIPGFPRDAKALRLTLDADDYVAAVRADCRTVWSKVEPGQLYWFPGTRIAGAISFSPRSNHRFCPTPILDGEGHGTMVASRAAASGYGACPDCLVVSVQVPLAFQVHQGKEPQAAAIDALGWLADNSDWIDAESNSWTPGLPVWDPSGETGSLSNTPELTRAIEDAASHHLGFWASGNGVAYKYGVAGHPTTASPYVTPSVIAVGAHDSGHVVAWHGAPPQLVSDGCDSWAAVHDDVAESGETVGGGTSAATPFVAGGAARILADARTVLGDDSTGVDHGLVARGPLGRVPDGPLADGRFTLAEWKEVVLKTASARPVAQRSDGPPCEPWLYPATPVKWSDVPDGYPEYLTIGYGAVDDAAVELAGAVLRGTTPLPDRSATDAFFTREGAARSVLYDLFSTG
jgi:hypothetical protein